MSEGEARLSSPPGRRLLPQAHNSQMTLHQSATLEGLPKEFISALRTLFDILDEKRIGFVKFSEIESRWQDDGSKGLPKGVIDSLRKVTPPNGLLSFERFCAGLKICLLRNQMESKKRASSGSRGGPGSGGNAGQVQPVGAGGGRTEGRTETGEGSSGRPPSAPLLDVDPKHPWSMRSHHLPGGNLPAQRTLSMPQLPADSPIGIPIKPALYGPPKPPRTALGMDKSEVRTALANWQVSMMSEEEKARGQRSIGDGQQAVTAPGVGLPQGQVSTAAQQVQQPEQQHKPARRREPRRHTLQNGIDYNMLKRMKQLEEEKSVLMSGLEAVERARDWYHKQISAVHDKITHLSRTGISEQWSEAMGERLELQRARVLEVNRHLGALTDPSSVLPLHMNLALTTSQSTGLITRLRHQNHLLTQEVNKKSERISGLEREKAALIRELLHARTGGGRVVGGGPPPGIGVRGPPDHQLPPHHQQPPVVDSPVFM